MKLRHVWMFSLLMLMLAAPAQAQCTREDGCEDRDRDRARDEFIYRGTNISNAMKDISIRTSAICAGMPEDDDQQKARKYQCEDSTQSLATSATLISLAVAEALANPIADTAALASGLWPAYCEAADWWYGMEDLLGITALEASIDNLEATLYRSQVILDWYSWEWYMDGGWAQIELAMYGMLSAIH